MRGNARGDGSSPDDAGTGRHHQTVRVRQAARGRCTRRSTTTPTGPTKASPTPDHYAPYHHPPPTKQPSPTSTSANGNDWAASSTSTTTPPNQHGRDFRQAQGQATWPTFDTSRAVRTRSVIDAGSAERWRRGSGGQQTSRPRSADNPHDLIARAGPGVQPYRVGARRVDLRSQVDVGDVREVPTVHGRLADRGQPADVVAAERGFASRRSAAPAQSRRSSPTRTPIAPPTPDGTASGCARTALPRPAAAPSHDAVGPSATSRTTRLHALLLAAIGDSVCTTATATRHRTRLPRLMTGAVEANRGWC